MLKALEQVAITQGLWKAAWPLSGLIDPRSRKGSAGDEVETEAVASYATELEALDAKIKQRGGVVASPDDDSDKRADRAAGGQPERREQ